MIPFFFPAFLPGRGAPVIPLYFKTRKARLETVPSFRLTQWFRGRTTLRLGLLIVKESQ